MKIKIELYGAFNSEEVKKTIEKALKEEGFETVDNFKVTSNEDNLLVSEAISTLKKYGFEFANMGYNPMHDRGVYRVKKGDECLGEIGLPATLTQQEVICTLKRIKEIKDSYVPRVEEIEFDL